MLSAKCRDFTEALTLKGDDFKRTCEHYMAAGASVKRIQRELRKDEFKSLKIKCYLCDSREHIALKCSLYDKRKGNLIAKT